MTELEFHPVADLFPMLADDELAELAEDIKQRGQLQPIVLDEHGRVLDGRNRLAACRLVDVEPIFETYEGDDPDGYALAVNGQRRQMTKAQKALVAADFLLSKEFGNGTQVARALGVSDALVSQAKQIVAYARELRDEIMVTGGGFAEAREVAARRKRAAEEARVKLDRLRAGAPDLASHVDDERMSLDDAIAALDAREEKAREEEDARVREAREREAVERDRRQRHSRSFGDSLVALWSLLDPDPAAFAEKTWDADANPHRTTAGAKEAFTHKGLRLLADRLCVLADHVDKSGGTL